MILGIVGDFDSKQMRSLIQKYFGSLPSSRIPQLQLPPVSQANQSKMFQVNLPQLTQSYVQLGHLGGKFNSPDYPALDVMNQVLNSFGGRLFNSVRSRQGLAYSVYGVWSPRYDYPGVFAAGGQIKAEPVKPAELAFAKESVLNSFVFNFEDPSEILSRLMRYEYYDYPADFLFRYQQSVKATTTADVQRVAKQYLKPEQLVTLVVGNATAIQPPLTELATQVIPVDITKPLVTK